MTQKITTYYIPQNLNITKGKIYTLYLNKITNLDLSSIINKSNNDIKNEQSEKTITLSKEEYLNLINILNTFKNIYNESIKLETAISKGRTK